MSPQPGAGVVPTTPLSLAHRGTFIGSQYYPGNNVGAWNQIAAADPNVIVEMDQWETTDHVPTYHHDPTLDADTNGTGKISSHSWSYIAAHKYDNGQAIPGYMQVISGLLAKYPYAYAVIDLKANPSSTAWNKLTGHLGPYKSRIVYYSSTSNAYTLTAKAHGFQTAYYQDGGAGAMPSVSTIEKYGTYAYTGGIQQYTASQRTDMGNAGIRVIGWGQDPVTWQEQADLGAWAVSSDHADQYNAWRAAR